MLKAGSVSLVLYHFQPGHHHEVNAWHDADHRPEVLGTIPHIYHSQRWVAPAAYVAARPPTRLPHGGGEYANMYWSVGRPEQVLADFEALGARLTLNGRMQPMQHIEGVWHGRLKPLYFSTSPRVAISPEAVPFAPSTGLVVSIVEIVGVGGHDAYGRWLETVHLPAVLNDDLFTACVTLMPAVPKIENVLVHLYYTDADDPTRAFAELLRLEDDRPEDVSNDAEAPGAAAMRRRIFASLYRPIVPGQYDFYA